MATSHLATTAAPEQFFTSTIVLHDGLVVALSPGGSGGGPAIALAAGPPLAVPAQHDLQGECGLATTAPTSSDGTATAEATPAESTASAIKPLPAEDYTLVVVLHLNRDGEQRILAAAPPVALTVT